MTASIISIGVGNNHQLNDQLGPLLNLEVGIGSDLQLDVQLVSVFSLDVLLKHSERNANVSNGVIILSPQSPKESQRGKNECQPSGLI